MITQFQHQRSTFAYRVLSALIAFSFILSVTTPPTPVYAQLFPQGMANLPLPGTMVPMSPGFTPPMVTGITIHPENPLEFDFIIGSGDDRLEGEAFEQESTRLIKYFLAALTVPEEEMWVNLSPYEKDRIIPQGFGDTEMGRDLLAQDYILKQLTASLMYPEDELGDKFWSKVRAKAFEKFGTAEIPMNTFNKVWIIPDEAIVYEHGASAFVVKSHLKVMLEEDYIALENAQNVGATGRSPVQEDVKVISGVSTEVIREILIPEIEKEVNNGETFANLRQIYNSVILAAWYKQNLKDSLLGQVYVGKNKTAGVDMQDKHENQKIYDQYLEAFKKGVYNYIKEDYDPVTEQVIPRKYFSGGTSFAEVETLLTRLRNTMDLDAQDLEVVEHFSQSGAGTMAVNVNLVEVAEGKKAEEVAEIAKPAKIFQTIAKIASDNRRFSAEVTRSGEDSSGVDIRLTDTESSVTAELTVSLEKGNVGDAQDMASIVKTVLDARQGDPVFQGLERNLDRLVDLRKSISEEFKRQAASSPVEDTFISEFKVSSTKGPYDVSVDLGGVDAAAFHIAIYDRNRKASEEFSVKRNKSSQEDAKQAAYRLIGLINIYQDDLRFKELEGDRAYQLFYLRDKIIENAERIAASSPLNSKDREVLTVMFGLQLDWMVHAARHNEKEMRKVVGGGIYEIFSREWPSLEDHLVKNFMNGKTVQEALASYRSKTSSPIEPEEDVIRSDVQEIGETYVEVLKEFAKEGRPRALGSKKPSLDELDGDNKEGYRQIAMRLLEEDNSSSPVKAVLPRVNPTKTESWSELKKLADDESRYNLRTLFDTDFNRTNKLNMALNSGIKVDFSKNLIDEETLDALLKLADKVSLKKAIEQMFMGEKINETEKRAVLHTALRNVKRANEGNIIVANGPVDVDGEDVMPKVISVLNKIKAFSEKVRSGEWKGATGKRIKHIVNVGIGGSDLGPKMASKALTPFGRDSGIQMHFVSNVDGTAPAEVIRELGFNPEETLIIIESKTFTTLETIRNAMTLKNWVREYYNNVDSISEAEAIRKHFVAVSTAEDLVSAFGIDTENMFEFWDWVGGRYSLWSAIGLPLAIYVGFDNFFQMLEGAREADEHFRTQPFESNIPVIKAVLGVWYRNFFDAGSYAVVAYDEYSSLISSYLAQGYMESNGKGTDRNGDFIADYQTGAVLWGGAGTDMQHATMQAWHQGTSIIPADLIGVVKSQNPIEKGDHHQNLFSNFVAQPYALAFGYKFEEVAKALNDGKLSPDELKWLAAHKTFLGNKPTTSILLNEMNPRTLGSLIALYEHQIMAEGIIYNIFSFDQWGVELGKVIAKRDALPFLNGSRPLSELDDVPYGESIRLGIEEFIKKNKTPSSPVDMNERQITFEAIRYLVQLRKETISNINRTEDDSLKKIFQANLLDLESDISRLKEKLRQIRPNADRKDKKLSSPVNDEAADENIKTLQIRLAELEEQEKAVKDGQGYGRNELTDIRAEIAEVRRQLDNLSTSSPINIAEEDVKSLLQDFNKRRARVAVENFIIALADNLKVDVKSINKQDIVAILKEVQKVPDVKFQLINDEKTIEFRETSSPIELSNIEKNLKKFETEFYQLTQKRPSGDVLVELSHLDQDVKEFLNQTEKIQTENQTEWLSYMKEFRYRYPWEQLLRLKSKIKVTINRIKEFMTASAEFKETGSPVAKKKVEDSLKEQIERVKKQINEIQEEIEVENGISTAMWFDSTNDYNQERVDSLSKRRLSLAKQIRLLGEEKERAVKELKEIETDLRKLRSNISSPIQKDVGGINLNPDLLDLQIKRDGNGIPLPVNLQPIHQMKIDGFVPVIINVTPIVNLPLLLGFSEKDAPVNSAGSSSPSKIRDLSVIGKYRNKYVRGSEYADDDIELKLQTG
ncbi:MAG: glucose-6-phosphate isomerase [Candidatus Omnitrophica bacterium]|nr:glucose-6-phosphate isomerase [Candidatus Omnitrophota bacterium]